MESTRRTFIAGACGLLVAGFGGLQFAAPASAAGVQRLANGKVRITLAKASELAVNGGVLAITTSKNRPIGIKRINAKRYVAFDLTCPHAGFAIVPEGDESEWECPGHGAKFNSQTGAALSGPTSQSLKPIKTALKAGVLTVG